MLFRSCLTSLSVTYGTRLDLKSLVRLPALTELGMHVDSHTLSSAAFSNAVQRVTSLSLWNSAESGENAELTGFRDALTNLQSLSLQGYELKDLDVMNDCSQLTSLRLVRFTSLVGMGFLTSLRSLKQLCLADVKSPDWIPNQMPLDHSFLPQLTQLVGDFVANVWMPMISSLHSLEAVELRCCYGNFASHKLSGLEQLQNLRILRIDTFYNRVLLEPEAHSLLQRLETLKLHQVFDERIRMRHDLGQLAELAPNLKITSTSRDWLNWVEDTCHSHSR